MRAIGDARIAIEEVIGGNADEDVISAAPSRGALWGRLGIAGWVAAVILAGGAVWGWLHPAPPEPKNVVRLTTTLPVATNVPGTLALSRDGLRLAYVSGTQHQIHVRMMDQLESRPIPGTDGAAFVCFSPDGQWISYMGNGPSGLKLKKIAVAGGPAQVLANVSGVIAPPTQDWLWTESRALPPAPLLSSPSPNQAQLAYVVGTPGLGSAQRLTWVDRKGVEQQVSAPPRNYYSLSLSPDGQHIALEMAGEGRAVWVYDLARGTLHKITSEQDGGDPVWTPDGKRLIYSQTPGAILRAPADSSGPPSTMTSSEKGLVPTSVSRWQAGHRA